MNSENTENNEDLSRITTPQPLIDMSRQTKRFVEGVQRLEFNDDRIIAVSAAATRFSRLVDGVIEAIPSTKNDYGNSSEMLENMDSAMQALAELVTVFREDAMADRTALPNMNDLTIGMKLFGMESADLANALSLITTETGLKPTEERTALLACFMDIGVPVPEVGTGPVVRIKTTLLLALIMVLDDNPKLEPLVVKAIIALNAVDSLAQGNSDDNSDVPPATGDGPLGENGPNSVGDKRCGEPFRIAQRGTGATPRQARNDAYRTAFGKAGDRCKPGCIPILTNTWVVDPDPLGNKKDQATSTLFVFSFKCVSAAG